MICYNKLFKKLAEAGINSTQIRKENLLPQSVLTKFRMLSSEKETQEEIFADIRSKLEKYKADHDGKEFLYDVSTKTIEELCLLLHCQPFDIIDWVVFPEDGVTSRNNKSNRCPDCYAKYRKEYKRKNEQMRRDSTK